jgi:hypothetical protein
VQKQTEQQKQINVGKVQAFFLVNAQYENGLLDHFRVEHQIFVQVTH